MTPGSTIKILPEELVNKIAAGEVVERPAAVVKELVENSIDAGATKINVEIQGAGSKLIQVADNGRGMSPEDFGLAVQRHATSKISNLDDLFNIQTLGFRGEALSSIAAVSKFSIEQNPSGQGITVTAKDLFYNTPARKKFLKSPTTEMGHIGDVVAKYAMAYPNIAFELIVDGKTLLQSSGSGKLKDAVLSVYGVELIKDLIEIEGTINKIKVSGLTSLPTLTRVDKNYENFYVNRRFVKNFLLNRALEEAYRTLIPNNRYPAAIILLDIDPKQIDVNVHPTKREIKFANNQVVMEAIRTVVQQALSNKSSVLHTPSSELHLHSQWDPPCQRWDREQKVDSRNSTLENRNGIWDPNIAEVLFPAEYAVSENLPLRPISTYKDTYIITTDGEDLVMIDQHAAHERVLYDRLTASSKQQASIEKQLLLLPENIEMDSKSFSTMKANLPLLCGLGFDLEEFGCNTFILRAIPAISSKLNPKQLLIDIVAELDNLGKSVQTETKQENIRKLIACHSAVKAGDKLSSFEINQLIKNLYATQNPMTCPHGRPIIFRMTEDEVKKKFAR